MATRHDPILETARWMEQLLLCTARESGTATVPSLPMDLYRAGDHYVLHMDMPGADPGSVDVHVEDRTLTIRAERIGREEADVEWLARERAVGTYVRQLTVGRGLALDAIDARYADGVLTLTIPVAEEARPRRIEVQHGRSATAIGSTADRESGVG